MRITGSCQNRSCTGGARPRRISDDLDGWQCPRWRSMAAQHGGGCRFPVGSAWACSHGGGRQAHTSAQAAGKADLELELVLRGKERIRRILHGRRRRIRGGRGRCGIQGARWRRTMVAVGGGRFGGQGRRRARREKVGGMVGSSSRYGAVDQLRVWKYTHSPI
jgi:hypothetical protein